MNRSAAISALRHFSHEECANCPRPGACIMLKSGVCLLTKGRRCGYFERSVLPIATRGLRRARKLHGKPRPIDDQRVVEAYRALHPEVRGRLIAESDDDGIAKRRCPDCDSVLARGQRVCPTCLAKRRLEAKWSKKRPVAEQPAVESLPQSLF